MRSCCPGDGWSRTCGLPWSCHLASPNQRHVNPFRASCPHCTVAFAGVCVCLCVFRVHGTWGVGPAAILLSQDLSVVGSGGVLCFRDYDFFFSLGWLTVSAGGRLTVVNRTSGGAAGLRFARFSKLVTPTARVSARKAAVASRHRVLPRPTAAFGVKRIDRQHYVRRCRSHPTFVSTEIIQD